MSEYILPHVDGYLKLGQDYDCSDIHLAVNSRPTWRRFGQLLPIWEEAPNLTPQDTEVLAGASGRPGMEPPSATGGRGLRLRQ